jgi:hypothetical protein
MKIYTELELLGFFRWLLETHELSYTEGVSPKYLDGLPLTDIHRTVCNAMAFRWFREKYNWQSRIEATSDQHSHQLGYNYFIWNNKTGEEYYTMPKDRPSGDWEFEKYEDAEIACLIKLIEIVKNETK